MSFAGHIYDMIRRDKENRELRQNLRERLKADHNSPIGKYQDCYKDITPEKLDRIANELKNKSRQDEYRMKKDIILLLLLLGGGIIVIMSIYLILN
ncbi:MAG: hypothetical protein LBV72_02475 [Tannerella sp.]|jgi:hypothetical protein|nr:hypothetical protein [Tannerella sp.]